MSEDAQLTGPVLVVGAGLIGTSVALALCRLGIEVWLSDRSEENLRTARGLGAGIAWDQESDPQVVLVAVPPAYVADEVVRALTTTGAWVSDVASLKGRVLARVGAAVSPTELSRYIGSHPMAGSERSGPLAASGALFEGRPWAIAEHPDADPEGVAVIAHLARLCGAEPVSMPAAEHDLAVARTSHVTQVVSTLVAAHLVEAPETHLQLSGQGLRDVTRVAGSDPAMWLQILPANAAAVIPLLQSMSTELSQLATALEAGDEEALEAYLHRGVAGHAAIPTKHGAQRLETRTVYVAIPDEPGALATLFAEVGEAGYNIEDVRVDHDLGRPVGLVELVIAEAMAEAVIELLDSSGWTVHG